MKHRLDIRTGICSACGLSVHQKLTTDCFGSLLSVNNIKNIATGILNYSVKLGWHSLVDIPTNHSTPKPSVNKPKKQTDEKIVRIHEDVPQHVHELIREVFGSDVTIETYGDAPEPEQVFLTDAELAFMFCCQRGGYHMADVSASRKAWVVHKALIQKGLVTVDRMNVVLTEAGSAHIAKLCAIPVGK